MFRKHLSYANIVATMALVFAMAGTAMATKHYLITSANQIKPSVLRSLRTISSTKQISPRVLAALKGNTGSTGPQGAPGVNGQDLTSHTPLPSGQSESGWFASGSGTSTEDDVAEGISFSQPLSEGLTKGHAVFNQPETTSAHCPGVGRADPGYLCLYAGEQHALTFVYTFGLPKGGAYELNGTGPYGFALYFEVTGKDGFVDGSWTVTAP